MRKAYCDTLYEGDTPIRPYLIITGTFTQTEEASAQEMFVVSVRSEELPEFLIMKLLLSWEVLLLFMGMGMDDR